MARQARNGMTGKADAASPGAAGQGSAGLGSARQAKGAADPFGGTSL